MIDINKNELRKTFRSIRKDLYNYYSTHISEKEIVMKNIELSILSFINNYCQNDKNLIVSCYYPIQTEIDCLSIIKNIKQNIKLDLKICLPIAIYNERILKFYEYNNDESLIIGKYGIKEPDTNVSKELLPDIILTPLLSFDKNKNRLGYGKGHYDNTFSNFNKNIKHKFISIGVAYDQQFYSDLIPTDEFDVKLDYIITSSGLI